MDRVYAIQDANYNVTALVTAFTTTGDANANGLVNAGDLNICAAHYGHAVAGGDAVGDFNHNGVVDDVDEAIWSSNMGNTATGSTWRVTERLCYAPYGAFTVSVLVYDDANKTYNWSNTASEYLGWNITAQGGRWNALTHQVLFGVRELNVDTGRWNTPEPSGGAYVDGLNLYPAFGDNPINTLDPLGLWGDGHMGKPKPPTPPRVALLQGLISTSETNISDFDKERRRRGIKPGTSIDYSYSKLIIHELGLIENYKNEINQIVGAADAKWEAGRGHSDFPGWPEFDWTLEDRDLYTSPFNPLSGSSRHFQNLPDVEAKLTFAVCRGDRDEFVRLMHDGQDYFSHYKAGWRFDFGKLQWGHIIPYDINIFDLSNSFGASADDAHIHASEWEQAKEWTTRWLLEWQTNKGWLH
jgi:hypothetical protein